MEDKITI